MVGVQRHGVAREEPRDPGSTAGRRGCGVTQRIAATQATVRTVQQLALTIGGHASGSHGQDECTTVATWHTRAAHQFSARQLNIVQPNENKTILKSDYIHKI